QLPQPVHFHDALPAVFAGFRQAPVAAGLVEVSLVAQAAKYFDEVLAPELPAPQNFVDRTLNVKVLALLAELVQRLQYVFVVDGLADPGLLQKPAEHAASRCEE